MPRPKLDHRAMSCYLPEKAHDEIREHSKSSGQTVGQVVAASWAKYRDGDSAFKAMAERNALLEEEVKGLLAGAAALAKAKSALEGKLKRKIGQAMIKELLAAGREQEEPQEA